MRITAAQPLALRRRGSAPEAEDGRERADTPADERFGPRSGRIWPVLVGCLAIAAVSLLFPSTPTYDPWAWIMWGREIVHLDLVTEGGPSWKPLPVIVTTLSAPFGEASLADLRARLNSRVAGRRFTDVAEVYFFRFREGRIAEAWGLEDNTSRLVQLGLHQGN